MSGAGTYGAAINEALGAVGELLDGPPPMLAGLGDAVTAAHARSRLYRGVLVTIQRIAIAAPVGDAWSAVTDRERDLLRQLQRDAAQSLQATEPPDRPRGEPQVPWDVPGARGPWGQRLTRAADSAGLAWELVGSHTSPEGLPRTREAVRGGAEARAVMTDAVLLTRGVAALDATLGGAVASASSQPEIPDDLRQYLSSVATDCYRVERNGLAGYAKALTLILSGDRHDDRSRLDALGVARPVQAPAPPASIAQAPQALAGYRAWLFRHRSELTTRDLASAASIGARFAGILGQLVPQSHSPDRRRIGATIDHFRAAFTHLAELHSIHPPPPGAHAVLPLADWASVTVRNPPSLDPAAAQTVRAGLARELAGLASDTSTALTHQVSNGRVFAREIGRDAMDVSIQYWPIRENEAGSLASAELARAERAISGISFTSSTAGEAAAAAVVAQGFPPRLRPPGKAVASPTAPAHRARGHDTLRPPPTR